MRASALAPLDFGVAAAEAAVATATEAAEEAGERKERRAKAAAKGDVLGGHCRSAECQVTQLSNKFSLHVCNVVSVSSLCRTFITVIL